MFPLKNRKIGGYRWGEKTFYSEHHLGTDYSAEEGTPLYAPCDGEIIREFTGEQGGLTIWFRPDNENVLIRFMHLSKFIEPIGKVKECAIIARTGNTGKLTKAPHLHLDISKENLDISDFSNFIDPEKYAWNKTMKVLDISHYQTVKDWAKIAKEVPCVILKATQGLAYIDPTFQNYRKNARENGLLVGAYHFADGNSYLLEAEHFLETVGEMQTGEFLVLDYEIHLENPVQWCTSFLNHIQLKMGFRPLLYINTSTYKNFDWKNENFWLASYGVNDGKVHTIPYKCVLHQYTSRGKIGGIDGNVDLSVGENLEDLKKLGKPKTTQNLPPEQTSDVQSDNIPLKPETATVPTNLKPQSVWQDALLEILNLIRNFFKL